MSEAIRLSLLSIKEGGGPFGAVIVKHGAVVGRGMNRVTISHDPTLHAEVVAIRDACQNLETYQLDGCVVYTSCEPCPMCFGALYWARPDKVYFANTKKDAGDIGFDDSFIYEEIHLPADKRRIPFERIQTKNALDVFNIWHSKQDKKEY
jgi:guanine deaminase